MNAVPSRTFIASLFPAVWYGIVSAFGLSAFLGCILWVNQGAHQPLWEAGFGFLTVILVTTLVVHMWKTGPQLKKQMESRLSQATLHKIVTGVLLGLLGAALVSLLWQQFNYLINMKQLTEANVLPNSEWLHKISELYSSDGMYGKWFFIMNLTVCFLWFCFHGLKIERSSLCLSLEFILQPHLKSLK